MNHFSADWLHLRESYDHRARNVAVERALAAWSCTLNKTRLRVVDLGAGTGSNFRALSPRLKIPQDWLLLDHDAMLLEQVAEQTRRWADEHSLEWRIGGNRIYIDECTIRRQQIDLAHGLTPPSRRVDLLCAAALMDLVSATWFESLIGCGCDGIYDAIHTVLSYDGRIEWQPQDAWDETARELVNRHQLSDKGFGPALGPQAPITMLGTLRRYGFEVISGRSDWLLTPSDQTMQTYLLNGWQQAIAQLAPSRELDAWAQRRHGLVDAGHSRLRVGHQDLFAYRPQIKP